MAGKGGSMGGAPRQQARFGSKGRKLSGKSKILKKKPRKKKG